MRSPQLLDEIEAGVQASLAAALDELEHLEEPAARPVRRGPPPLPDAQPPRPMRAFPPPLPSS